MGDGADQVDHHIGTGPDIGDDAAVVLRHGGRHGDLEGLHAQIEGRAERGGRVMWRSMRVAINEQCLPFVQVAELESALEEWN